ncbi:MAG TPA: hypothetical protein VI792_10520, partial [Candidatus Eisenbacteria bacterium]
MSDMAYLFNNTVGGSVVALGVVVLLGWYRLTSNRLVRWGPFQVPSEIAYIIPSGICTAVVIPTTTLMYTLPISVMVAMVIMRGSIIVISRIVDELQIRQGILTKRVYAEENWAVVFALLAVATNVLLIPVAGTLDHAGVPASRALGLAQGAGHGSFDFLRSGAALTIMGLYITAYAIRIYIMNFFKNTRGRGVPLDNQGFFAIEQFAASATMAVLIAFFALSPSLLGWADPRVLEFGRAVRHPEAGAMLSGVPYGTVAFFSVFIFMFKGRTATFAGLVNRLTSLLAGTTATLLLFLFFGMSFPSAQDWVSVAFILVAVYFLGRAEDLRVRELQRAGEAELPAPAVAGAARPTPAA